MDVLNAETRVKDSFHEAKKLRRMGKIPGILYGKSIQNIMFELSELELNKEINVNGEHGAVEIHIEGEKHKALVKNIQREPVSHEVIHIDLELLEKDKKIQAEVPIVFEGENLILRKGGIVQKEKTNIKIRCSSENIPNAININLSSLDVGDKYRVCDVEFSKDITFIEDPSAIIASITYVNKVMEERLEKTDIS